MAESLCLTDNIHDDGRSIYRHGNQRLPGYVSTVLAPLDGGETVSDSDEEDWFEQAISKQEGETEEAAEESETEFPERSGETEGDETESDIEAVEDDPFGERPASADSETETAEEDPRGGGTPGEGDVFGGDAGGDSEPFETDFSTAFRNAPDPGAAGSESGGPTGPDGAPDLGAPGGPGFGETDSFDDEAFESDIDRLDTGIEGLDQMILGGVPKRSLMVAIGSAGTGKTTFGMEFLRTALEDGKSTVYISLEESRERILNTADEKGWEFSRYEDEGQLAIITFDPVEMANTLSSIQSELPRLIEEFDAERLVLDSVSLLEMMYDRPSKRRSEVFDFARSLKQAGITTFVTSEASQENPFSSRYGIIEYLADAVFVLQYVRPSNFQETRLAIEIQKIRDANHSREMKPYEITDEGISVYRQANIF